mmetsp:Transcript_15360/g.23123  ORF Transcript_15360/g.23123 Transcript_15360/m.23123 type:complete len:106 (-) Transcript_15360:112-429(-)|eukprot:CAMPEP_0185027442 /NCGR_PEP_ID=MMETSP1103-20130426/12502_1 /TAXON_ID=36769 /ORGANISM="Paraphysomonas bandaiensis, Strain Caron Lab Isolate" /LENGTH=105 /DNA_ID=CAMNT_0027561435 /DNA_START=64 /DNA_END=381 /DNA_ORIENTATION=-
MERTHPYESCASTTTTTTATTTVAPTETEQKQRLVLRLREKKVTWDEEVVNNEHLGRKSSKRCCIFHKQKRFGESDSDESDSDIEEAENSSSNGGGVKPYQRHHA